MEGNFKVRDLEDCMDLLVEARKRKNVMEAWEVFPSDLELGDKIGSGKFGAVSEGLWNGHKVAIKTMKRATPTGMSDFEREAEIMRNLKHSNVLDLLGVVLTQQPALIVLELMGASFLSLLSKCELTDKDILDCAMQVRCPRQNCVCVRLCFCPPVFVCVRVCVRVCVDFFISLWWPGL